MISIILWVIGGIVALSVLFFVIKMFLILIGMKKILGIVKEEIEAMPQDYQAARKEVENENTTAGQATKGFVKKTLDRWYNKM